MIDTYMTIVAFASLASWVPQITRMITTKSTDDFSLWTTAILAWVNFSFLAQAIIIDDNSFILLQGISCVMLCIFATIIIRYRTTPVFKWFNLEWAK